jgi:hypothetical protein
VSSPEPVEIISLQRLREHLNITDEGEDEELQRFLDAASLAVEDYTGQVWARRTVVDEVFVSDGVAFLQPPVMSVESVTSLDGDVELSLPTGVDGFTGTVSGLTDGWAQVTYTAGPAAVPTHVQMATAIIAAHLWTTQRVRATSSLLEAAPVAAGRGYLIPYQAAQLLGGKSPNRP